MASQTSLVAPAPPPRVHSPRHTKTIGARLTAVEIEALDTFIASQERQYSRAGTIAVLAIERLIAAGLLPEGHEV